MLFTLKFLLFKQENGRANFSSIPNAKKMNKHLIKQLPNWRKIKVFQYCWRKYRKQKGDNTAHTHTQSYVTGIRVGVCDIVHQYTDAYMPQSECSS